MIKLHVAKGNCTLCPPTLLPTTTKPYYILQEYEYKTKIVTKELPVKTHISMIASEQKRNYRE